MLRNLGLNGIVVAALFVTITAGTAGAVCDCQMSGGCPTCHLSSMMWGQGAATVSGNSAGDASSTNFDFPSFSGPGPGPIIILAGYWGTNHKPEDCTYWRELKVEWNGSSRCFLMQISGSGDQRQDGGYGPPPYYPESGMSAAYDPNLVGGVNYQTNASFSYVLSDGTSVITGTGKRYELCGRDGLRAVEQWDGSQVAFKRIFVSGALVYEWKGDGGAGGGQTWPQAVVTSGTTGGGIATYYGGIGGSTATKVVYTVTVPGEAGLPVRKRVTEVSYTTTGSRIFSTTITGYDEAGRLRYVVSPEGVHQYLTLSTTQAAQGFTIANPESACGLDNDVTDATWKSYASTWYEYDSNGKISHAVSGCACSGTGYAYTWMQLESSFTTYNPEFDPAEYDSPHNVCTSCRRTVTPAGGREVDFINAYDEVVLNVKQCMSGTGTIIDRSITHYLRCQTGTTGTNGLTGSRTTETRYPSVCSDYCVSSTTDAGFEWVVSVTSAASTQGMANLRTSEYVDGCLAWDREWVRQGTSGTAYYLSARQYSTTNSVLLKSYQYPTLTTSCTAGIVTNYAYTMSTSSANMPAYVVEETVTLLAVATTANGSGTSAMVKRHYDAAISGSVVYSRYNDWTRHEDGGYSYAGVDSMGRTVKTIEDVDTVLAGTALPGGWPASTGGAHLVTEYGYDDYGRSKWTLSPDGMKSMTWYSCCFVSGSEVLTSHLVTLSAPMVTGSADPYSGNYGTLPVAVTVTDMDGHSVMSGQALTTPTDVTDDWVSSSNYFMALSGTWISRTMSEYGTSDADRFRLLSTMQLPEASTTNGAYVTSYGYDAETGRQIMRTSPDGTITYSVFDSFGRQWQTWVGTTATGATQADPSCSGGNSLQKVSEVFYDEAVPGSGISGVGDGYMTSRRDYYATGAYYKTTYSYDYRGRLEQTKGADGVISKSVYDHMGRVTESLTYAGEVASSNLRAKTANDYDEAGRVWRSTLYGVSTTGAITGSMATTYWYDVAGRQIKTCDANGLFNKTAYDRIGRTIATYVCFDAGDSGYADAGNVTGDTVIEQTETIYNGKGQPVCATRFMRKHNDGTTTGALSATNAVYMASVSWYDQAGRLTTLGSYGRDTEHQVYGTNCVLLATNGIPTVAGAAAPTASITNCLVTQYGYNDGTGHQITVTDPAGIVTRTFYNDVGAVTHVIEGFTAAAGWYPAPSGYKFNGTLSGSRNAEFNRITKYAYNAAGQRSQIIAVDPDHDGSESDNQLTKYFYGTTKVPGSPAVYRNDVLAAVVYPDSADDLSGDTVSGADHVSYTFDLMGRTAGMTDQRGVQHNYTFNAQAQFEADIVETGATTGSEHFVNTVWRIQRAYDDIGRLADVTCYSSTTANPANIVNQVANTYDSFGRMVKQQQEVGAVSSTSLAVQYGFDDTKAGRASSITLPNGRVLYYAYDGDASGVADKLSRVAAICSGTGRGDADANAIVAYEFNGLGQMVVKSYPWQGPSGVFCARLGLRYTGTNQNYEYLDAWGRVKEQAWVTGIQPSGTDWVSGSVSATDVVFRIAHGYDYASNRLYAERLDGYPTASQVYQYDGLHRLVDFQAGSKISGTTMVDAGWLERRQNWTLDQLGNQTQVQDFGQLDWYRNSFNAANEFTGTGTSRMVRADRKPLLCADDFSNAAATPAWSFASGTFAFSGLATASGTTVATKGEKVGPVNVSVAVALPGANDWGGIVFGRKGSGEYWLLKLDRGASQLALLTVSDSGNAYVKGTAAWTSAGTAVLTLAGMRGSVTAVVDGNILATFGLDGDCWPVGKVGLAASTGVAFDDFAVADEALATDALGRWMIYNAAAYVTSANGLYLGGAQGGRTPSLMRGVHVGDFQADFKVTRCSGTSETFGFVYDAADQHHFKSLTLCHGAGGEVVSLYQTADGCVPTCLATGTVTLPTASGTSDELWFRVTCVGGIAGTISVNCATSAGGLSSGTCLAADRGEGFGGHIGFGGGSVLVHEMEVGCYTGSNWATDVKENFALSVGGTAAGLAISHDAAGNQVFDGMHVFKYDAWGRLAAVHRGYFTGTNLAAGACVGTISYDGLGRRATKAIANSGDWDMTQRFLWDGWRMVEIRDGSGELLQQYVWGTQYIDELVQVGVAPAGGSTHASHAFWVCQDANYNVLGVLAPAMRSGEAPVLVERYEYTPYGQRSVYCRGEWRQGDMDLDGLVNTDDYSPIDQLLDSPAPEGYRGDADGNGLVNTDDYVYVDFCLGLTTPVQDSPLMAPRINSSRGILPEFYPRPALGLCPFGHQGLFEDREFGGQLYVRARNLPWMFMRWPTADGAGYSDGLSLYELDRSSPVVHSDPIGLAITISYNMYTVVPLSDFRPMQKVYTDSYGGYTFVGGSGVDPWMEADEVYGKGGKVYADSQRWKGILNANTVEYLKRLDVFASEASQEGYPHVVLGMMLLPQYWHGKFSAEFRNLYDWDRLLTDHDHELTDALTPRSLPIVLFPGIVRTAGEDETFLGTGSRRIVGISRAASENKDDLHRESLLAHEILHAVIRIPPTGHDTVGLMAAQQPASSDDLLRIGCKTVEALVEAGARRESIDRSLIIPDR